MQKRLATKLRACLYIPSGDGVSGKPHHLMESRSGLGNEVLEDASHLYITTMAVKENSMYRWLLCQCLPNCPARCDSGDIMAVSTTSRSDVGRTDSQPIQAPSLSCTDLKCRDVSHAKRPWKKMPQRCDMAPPADVIARSEHGPGVCSISRSPTAALWHHASSGQEFVPAEAGKKAMRDFFLLILSPLQYRIPVAL